MLNSSSFIQIGSTSISGPTVFLGLVLCVLLLLLFMVFALLRGARFRQVESQQALQRTVEMEYRLAEVSGQLHHFTQVSQGAQAEIARTLDERLNHVGQKLGTGLTDQAERTHHSLTQLYERLAVIDTAQKTLTSLSGEMLTLKDILANKQTRGAFGQGRMEAIIRDGLHSTAYKFQATLSNGTRPDCLVRLPDSGLSLVIDAKFPLEAFNALRDAKLEEALRPIEARLRQDINRHIKDISEKYLLTGETHETAIMFVPSESIYAELHERFEDLIQKAYRSHIILASPNILMLLVQTLQTIFKDSAMREQAHVIQSEVTHLLDDVRRLRERVGDLQKHFGSAVSDLEKITVSSDKIVKRGLRIEAFELETAAPQTASVPSPSTSLPPAAS